MNFLLIATLNGALSVALGAFGAHGLKAVLTPEMLQVFETGVRYHFIHALALIGLCLYGTQSARDISTPAYLFIAGILLFSFSLYLLSLTGTKWLGAVTPFGGVAFIAAWILWAKLTLQS